MNFGASHDGPSGASPRVDDVRGRYMEEEDTTTHKMNHSHTKPAWMQIRLSQIAKRRSYRQDLANKDKLHESKLHESKHNESKHNESNNSDPRPKYGEVLLYVVYMVLFLGVTFGGGRGEDAFWFSQSLQNALINTEFHFSDSQVPKYFANINQVVDYWNWLQGPFMDNVYPTEWYNGVPLNGSQLRYVEYVQRLVGPITLRQKRVKPNSCSILPHERSIVNQCMTRYSHKEEDRSPYGPGGIYTYTPPTGLADTYFAYINEFDGGGFVTELSHNGTEAALQLDELRENFWIDDSTRAIFVDVTLYNANINYFGVVRLSVEFPPSGGAVPSSTFRIIRFFQYEDASDYARLVFELILVLLMFYYIFQEVQEVRQGGLMEYLRDSWNYIDVLNLLTFLVVIAMRIFTVSYVGRAHYDLANDSFINNNALAFLIDMERNINAANAFIIWFRVFKYIRINQRLSQLTNTLSTAATDIFVFLFIFFIVFFGYAQAGWMLFSSDIQNFRNLKVSIYTLFRQLLGDGNFDVMEQSNRYLGPIFYFSYAILVFFVLMNMFLAIINDTYSEVKAEAKRQSNARKNPFKVLFDTAVENAKAILRRNTTKVAELRQAIEEAEEHDDNNLISANEIQHMVSEHGKSLGAGRANALVHKYDADGDNQLDRVEMRKLIADLKKEEAELTAMAKELDENPASARGVRTVTEVLHHSRAAQAQPHVHPPHTLPHLAHIPPLPLADLPLPPAHVPATEPILPARPSARLLPPLGLPIHTAEGDMGALVAALNQLSSHIAGFEARLTDRVTRMEVQLEALDRKLSGLEITQTLALAQTTGMDLRDATVAQSDLFDFNNYTNDSDSNSNSNTNSNDSNSYAFPTHDASNHMNEAGLSPSHARSPKPVPLSTIAHNLLSKPVNFGGRT